MQATGWNTAPRGVGNLKYVMSNHEIRPITPRQVLREWGFRRFLDDLQSDLQERHEARGQRHSVQRLHAHLVQFKEGRNLATILSETEAPAPYPNLPPAPPDGPPRPPV